MGSNGEAAGISGAETSTGLSSDEGADVPSGEWAASVPSSTYVAIMKMENAADTVSCLLIARLKCSGTLL